MPSASPVLTPAQLELLAQHGSERRAEAGETLFDVGDKRYPFIAVLEGSIEIHDPEGNRIVGHGPGNFVGEMNLLTGQTLYLSGVAMEPTRYIAVERETLRELLAQDGNLADVVLNAFIRRREVLQQKDVGIEIVGPRSSDETRALVDWLRRSRLPHRWREPGAGGDPESAELVAAIDPAELPLVILPGGETLRAPSVGRVSRALGIGLDLAGHEEVDLLIVGGGPAGLGAAVYGASEGLNTLVVEGTVLGGQAGMSRRIENYLGFPGGISGTELTTRAVTQARKFSARTASPYRATALRPGAERHVVALDDGVEVAARAVVLATGADYRRLPVEGLAAYEGVSVFYAAGPPEARACEGAKVGVIGGGNSAAQAAIWLARFHADVTLLHRREELSETMSNYLISDLERAGVAVRGRSEVAELHGDDGELAAVTLRDGERLEITRLFCFLGADPCTEWVAGVVACDEAGFVLTGAAAADGAALLETSVPGVFAAGDVRAGSVKRCATAVGEGAMVVRFVHERLAGRADAAAPAR